MPNDASRELDAAVAVAVMGYVWRICHDEPGEYVKFIAHPDYIDRVFRGIKLREPTDADTQPPNYMNLPHYSTDIASAWSIVGAMAKKQFEFVLWNDASGWTARFHDRGDRMEEATCLFVSRAICLAALKAIGAPRAH
jgi:hypothetical protein